MKFASFKNFSKWIIAANLSLQLLSPKIAFTQPSLETIFTTKDPIYNKLLNKKLEEKMQVKAEYDQENKEVNIWFYTPNWDDTSDKYTLFYNIRSDSNLYLILPRDNTEFIDIDQEGYSVKVNGEDGVSVKLEGEDSSGEWERLIPYNKNPYEKVKNFVKGKAIKELLPDELKKFLESFAEAFEFEEGLEKVKMDDLAERLGREYEVREIEMYTPEGFNRKTLTARRIKIELKHAPEKSQRWLLVYNLSLGSQTKIKGPFSCEGRLPIKILGSIEKNFEEENIDKKILQTLNEESNIEKWEYYLKKIPLSLKKYLPHKEELPEEFNLYHISYSIETKEELEGIIAEYFDKRMTYMINVIISKKGGDLDKDRDDSFYEGVYYNKNEKIFYFMNLEAYDPDIDFDDQAYAKKIRSIKFPFPRQIQRLNLEKVLPEK